MNNNLIFFFKRKNVNELHVYGCINSDYTERSKEEITLCPFLSSSPSYLNKKKN